MTNAQPHPPEQPRRRLWARLRAYFITGIIVVAPLALTVYLVTFIVGFIDQNVLPLLGETWNPENYLPFAVPGIGGGHLRGRHHPHRLDGDRTDRPHCGQHGRAAARTHAGGPIGLFVFKQIFETVFSHDSRRFAMSC